LCGGTHVGHTGELGYFQITHESAVAAGVRRIEAVCGWAAGQQVRAEKKELMLVKELIRSGGKSAVDIIYQLLQEEADLKKKVEHFENRLLVGVRNELLTKDSIINGITFIGEIVEVGNADALKKLCFDLRNNLNDHLVVLAANIGGKPAVAIGMSDTVAAARGLDAGKMIKEIVAPLIKGGGGGQKTLATAGGQEAGQLSMVIERVRQSIQ
jgi:alanyl-tRNA synthetase